MNLVSLLPIKFTKKCERVFALLFGQNKTKLPICRSRVKQRKMPGQFIVVQGIDKQDKQKR